MVGQLLSWAAEQAENIQSSPLWERDCYNKVVKLLDMGGQQ